MQYRIAKKTLSYFNNISCLKLKDSYGKHLQLYTAILSEYSNNTTIAVASYSETGPELRHIATPVLNNTLPRIYNFWKQCSNSDPLIPLLVIGHSFSEVFERKISLLSPSIPIIYRIQYINVSRFFNYKTSRPAREKTIKKNFGMLESRGEIRNEEPDFMAAIYDYLCHGKEIGGKKYDVLDWEVQAGEGTKRAEKIDFLSVERSNRWLTVIELKFTNAEDIRLHGSIFQGMDYCNWVEKHKYELSMIYSDHKVHTRHRTRLILINGPEGFPKYYPELIRNSYSKDKYQEIECYRLDKSTLPLSLERI